MHPFQSVKILIFILAVLLVAKPLVAFNMYKRVLNTDNQSNRFLLSKLIRKRKEGEYTEDVVAEMSSVQQKITAPIFKLLLRYASFIALFLGFRFWASVRKTSFGLKNTFFKLVPADRHFLLVGKLSI